MVSVGSASERKHGARRSPERVSRRTRHPESASRRDTTIERRMRARATRAFDAERVARIVASPRRKLELGRGHRGSRAISWSPPAPGGQPSARVRLRERGAPWPRRDRDARARARREENRRAPCGQPEHGRSTKPGAARRERSRARAPKRAREERNIKVMPRRARRSERGVPAAWSVNARTRCVRESVAAPLVVCPARSSTAWFVGLLEKTHSCASM